MSHPCFPPSSQRESERASAESALQDGASQSLQEDPGGRRPLSHLHIHRTGIQRLKAPEASGSTWSSQPVTSWTVQCGPSVGATTRRCDLDCGSCSTQNPLSAFASKMTSIRAEVLSAHICPVMDPFPKNQCARIGVSATLLYPTQEMSSLWVRELEFLLDRSRPVSPCQAHPSGQSWLGGTGNGGSVKHHEIPALSSQIPCNLPEKGALQTDGAQVPDWPRQHPGALQRMLGGQMTSWTVQCGHSVGATNRLDCGSCSTHNPLPAFASKTTSILGRSSKRPHWSCEESHRGASCGGGLSISNRKRRTIPTEPSTGALWSGCWCFQTPTAHL